MSRTNTVELLNDVDSFERKLSWILFQAEIAGLWAEGDDGWRPGDSLFPYPNMGRGGQWVRPLFEVVPDQPWRSEDFTSLEACDLHCIDCDVRWCKGIGDATPVFNCWVCDKPGVTPYFLEMMSFRAEQDDAPTTIVFDVGTSCYSEFVSQAAAASYYRSVVRRRELEQLGDAQLEAWGVLTGVLTRQSDNAIIQIESDDDLRE